MNTIMEIISKEVIKPTSQTPPTLRDHKLSLLDQLAPPIYIPLIFFYQLENKNHEEIKRISQQLKQSLSDTLTQYYPLSGRFNGKVSVNCNDAGVEYVETRVHAQLAEVIEQPSMEELKRYLPKQPYCKEAEDIPLAIQVNFFDCGGIAICACISHTISDGSSLATFMNAWAATCRGDHAQVMHPIFDSATYFPPAKDMSCFGSLSNTGITQEKITTRRFVFNKEKLAALKEAVVTSTGSPVKDPTRVECVTCLIWRHLMNPKIDNKKSFVAVHAVNLRPRMNPSLSEQVFGNIWSYTFALTTPESDKDFPNLANNLRDAIRSMNSNYVDKTRQGDEYLRYVKKSVEFYFREDVEFYSFSSWCRFPLYEVNYGWGKPAWVCTTTLPVKNLSILMSTKCGEGIEAWVNMDEHDSCSIII